MHSATTELTEAAADRSVGKAHGMRQNNSASGRSRHHLHRWPGYSQGGRFRKERHRPGFVLPFRHTPTAQRTVRTCHPHRTWSNRRRNAGGLCRISTSVLRRCNARCSRITSCPAELGYQESPYRTAMGASIKAMGSCWGMQLLTENG